MANDPDQLRRRSMCNIPDRLYELLPYLYAIAGVVTINYVETSLGYASGILLIFTAGLVFLMRSDYRQGKADKNN